MAPGGRTVPYARTGAGATTSALRWPRAATSWWPDALDNVVAKTSVAILAGLAVFVGVQAFRGPDSALARQRPVLVTALNGGGDGIEPSSGVPSATVGGALTLPVDSALVDSLRGALAGDGLATAVGVVSGAAVSARQSPTDRVPSATPPAALSSGIGLGGQATRVPLAPGSGAAPSLAMTRLPAEGATPSAYLELVARANARRITSGEPAGASLAAPAPAAPGVPGITRQAMPLSDAQQGLVRRVAPATRPTARAGTDARVAAVSPSNAGTRAVVTPRATTPGTSSPSAAAPNAAAPSESGANARAPRAASSRPSNSPAMRAGGDRPATPGLDQIQLESGRRLQGRVEVIRASSVVFRDAETGLRYEFAKDDVDEIITEFGNPVRFRQASGARARQHRRPAHPLGGRALPRAATTRLAWTAHRPAATCGAARAAPTWPQSRIAPVTTRSRWRSRGATASPRCSMPTASSRAPFA